MLEREISSSVRQGLAFWHKNPASQFSAVFAQLQLHSSKLHSDCFQPESRCPEHILHPFLSCHDERKRRFGETTGDMGETKESFKVVLGMEKCQRKLEVPKHCITYGT